MERTSSQMTLVEFLAWEEGQCERNEFYRGQVFAMVGSTARHNRVILNLAGRIDGHLDGTPCQVFAESMKVQFNDGILYPDVMVTCGKADAGDEKIIIAPKLVIEVLSPSTSGYDKRHKFALYRTLPSLLEYALIDPVTRRVEVFTKAESAGIWLFKDQGNDAAMVLDSIGFTLPKDAVFRGIERDSA